MTSYELERHGAEPHYTTGILRGLANPKYLRDLADAACFTGHNPDTWTPDGWGDRYLPQIREAKAVCADCPVRAKCLEYALADTEDTDTIRGGLTPAERARLRKNGAGRAA